MFHRVAAHHEARLAYLAAMFTDLLSLFHQLHPEAGDFKVSIAKFSL
jgi:hypothetical protein